MVLEELIPVKTAEQRPLFALPIAFLYATLAIFIALWIFPSTAAIVAVFLTTIAAMPLFLSIIGFEKTKEESSKAYIKELLFSMLDHGEVKKDKLLLLFVWLFLGFAIASTFWFAVLPANLVQDLFHLQLNTIKEINIAISGNAIATSFFVPILVNNIKVLTFSILFSFIYGAGAIFILAWNASVIGVAMGGAIKSSISTAEATFLGLGGAVTAGLFRFLLHGVPEILAYFIGALAGSLLSVAIIRKEFETPQFGKTLLDFAGLTGLALGLLIVAALIEVTISPLLG